MNFSLLLKFKSQGYKNMLYLINTLGVVKCSQFVLENYSYDSYASLVQKYRFPIYKQKQMFGWNLRHLDLNKHFIKGNSTCD